MISVHRVHGLGTLGLLEVPAFHVLGQTLNGAKKLLLRDGGMNTQLELRVGQACPLHHEIGKVVAEPTHLGQRDRVRQL